MASEWKCALEKSLIDAAKFPLPVEVFKVRRGPACLGVSRVKTCLSHIISHYLKEAASSARFHPKCLKCYLFRSVNVL